MCFSIPLRVTSFKNDRAQMEDGRLVNTSMIDKVKKNDWLLVQSNLAVDKLSEKDAKIMRKAIKEVNNELSKGN